MAVAPTPQVAPPPELTLTNTIASMRAFALAGLRETMTGLNQLQGDDAALRRQMIEVFGADEPTIGSELNEGKLRQATNQRFLPLPMVRGKATKSTKAYFLSFFRPKFRLNGTPEECDFELLLVCKDKKSTIGFAFERGRHQNETHGYTHVQLRHTFKNCAVRASLGDEFHHSYPAWPVRCRPLGDTWLAVLVTLYGLSGQDEKGLGAIISTVNENRAFTQGRQMLDRARYLFEVPKT